MKSTFQLILLVIFSFVAVIAVLMFSGILPGGIGPLGAKPIQTVTMWGPYNGDIENFIGVLNDANTEVVQIKYVPKTPESYTEDLIEAFARSEGPDLFFVDQTMLNRLAGKTVDIPYSVYPQRDYINDFSDGSSVFMTTTGLKALPLFIDPLVMYFNRTMYTSAGIVIVPKNWTELVATLKPINEVDTRNNVRRSAVAMGEFNNITNAKYLFSTLVFQAGNPIVEMDKDNNYRFVLGESFGFTPTPAQAATEFFVQFGNPAQSSYSWNRSLPRDKDFFVAENLAVYFGLASELADLRQKNPHLNLDVAVVPQKDSQKRITFGNYSGLGIAKSSKKQNAAATAAMILSQTSNLEKLSGILGVEPARRNLLALKAADPFKQIFRDSAAIARSWIDPDTRESNKLFLRMIDGVQTGQLGPATAASSISGEMSRLFNKI